MLTSKQLFSRRRSRNRTALAKVSTGRPQLSVHRSGKNIYAQIIDDKRGVTIASASTLEKDLRGSLKSGANVEAALSSASCLLERAAKPGVSNVVFDRGGFIYHGRVRALAEAAREAGLEF